MITQLRIADLGVIAEAALELAPGFTVVTGETGAGKTMIVSSLSLLLGLRADPKLIRRDAAQARIEARFEVAEREELATKNLEIEFDERELLVARTITQAGRNRCRVGSAQVPVSTLSEVVSQLVTIHGQSEQRKLSEEAKQREILDSFAGLETQVARYHDTYRRHRAAVAKHDQLVTDSRSRAREVDLLRFGLDEIAAVAPSADEDDQLAAEQRRLEAADDLRGAALRANQALSGDDEMAAGALTQLAAAHQALRDSPDDASAKLAGRAAEAAALVADLAADLASYLADLDENPGRLEEIAARRAALAGLTRKYGATVAEVLQWSSDSANQLAKLETSDTQIAELAGEITELEESLRRQAQVISQARQAAAIGFAEAVHAEFPALAMPHAKLQVTVSPTDLGPYGADQAELLFTANPGMAPRPLGKAASGGELSRIRLAIEVVLHHARQSQTGAVVFDEVDAGVGGKVAIEIGRRLARLSASQQVIVVTHLAQVAAFADRHWVVTKADDGQITTSGVHEVAGNERIAELSRMMAGIDNTKSGLAHAADLLRQAANRG